MGSRKGQGGGGKKGGARGWGKGGGVRGMESIFKWSFLQNRYRNFRLGCRNEWHEPYDTKSWGIPDFAGNPRIMTSRSRKYVIISPKKFENEMCERFQLIIYARRSSHLGKLAHFEFLNSNISVFGHYLKPKIGISTDFSVIWRWYKRLVIAFSGLRVKIGGWCGSSAHGSKISNWLFDGMAPNFP